LDEKLSQFLDPTFEGQPNYSSSIYSFLFPKKKSIRKYSTDYQKKKAHNFPFHFFSTDPITSIKSATKKTNRNEQNIG